jgi:hypothetical protein
MTMYGIIHMDASGDEDPPIEDLSLLYDELYDSGIEDGNVAVIHDDSHWCMSAHRDGGVIFECLGEKNSERHMDSVPKWQVLAMWKRLIEGEVDGLLKESWKPGYK